ncbi:methylamine utilization protein [soil metagenome]
MNRKKLLAVFAGLTATVCAACNQSAATSPTAEPVTAVVKKPFEAATPAVTLAPSPISTNAAQAGQWVTIKGTVVWPKDAKVPAAVPLVVGTDKAECEKKGPLMNEELVINEKNRGLKNIFVYLRPADKDTPALTEKDIKPELLKPKSVVHEVDQPCCMFIPRALALRSGDFINFKNSSPITHNVNFSADAPSPSENKTIPSKGNYQDPKPFVAQPGLASFACSIHPWMSGKFMIFDHPYYAVTDADGKFEIKDCPAGKYRIVYRSGDKGYSQGKLGNKGWEITIKAGANGTMEVEPHEFVVPEAK